MEIITASVNLGKLDKSKFIKGKKGTYVDLVLIPTPESQYGDYLIKQGLSKEDRAKKPDMPILGNAKLLKSKKGNGNGGTSNDDSGDYDF